MSTEDLESICCTAFTMPSVGWRYNPPQQIYIYRSLEDLFRHSDAHNKYVANRGFFDLDNLFLNVSILIFLACLWWDEWSDGLNDMGCSSSSEQGLFDHIPSPSAALKIDRNKRVFIFKYETH